MRKPKLKNLTIYARHSGQHALFWFVSIILIMLLIAWNVHYRFDSSPSPVDEASLAVKAYESHKRIVYHACLKKGTPDCWRRTVNY